MIVFTEQGAINSTVTLCLIYVTYLVLSFPIYLKTISLFSCLFHDSVLSSLLRMPFTVCLIRQCVKWCFLGQYFIKLIEYQWLRKTCSQFAFPIVTSAQNSASWFWGKSLNCCHQMADFGAKIHQIRCRLGLRPRPRWRSLQHSPDPLAGSKGPYF